MRRRFRLLCWMDEAGNPLQAAMARYDDDEKIAEVTWTPEPFDDLADVEAAAWQRIGKQLTLW